MTKPKYKAYNGHKNWNHWNVSLWLNNDEGLYQHMNQVIAWCRRRQLNKHSAAILMLGQLQAQDCSKTPDGAPYSVSSIESAMREL